MKTLLLSLSLILSLTFATAQNFPYLNASTGTTKEYIVDADSNIIMFHANRIEKLDKNFSPIWIKSYSGLTFKNLLLSKTGSLYFIAGGTSAGYYDKIGQVDHIGNLNWCKSLPSFTAVVSSSTQTITLQNANQMLLDRNNDLIITGNGPGTGSSAGSMYFLKLDTLGDFMKLRILNNNNLLDPHESIIINDVNGIYTVSSWGYGFEGPVLDLIYKYSDLTDLIICDPIKAIGYMGSTGQAPSSNEHIIKSKNQSDVFYVTNNTGAFSSTLNNTFTTRKIKDTTIIWGIQFQTSSPFSLAIDNIEEDHLKNTFLSVSEFNVNNNKRNMWIVKIDSNGVSDNKKNNFIQNFGAGGWGPPVADSITQFKRHYGNKFFYSIETSNVTLGPLSITKMDSTIGSYCAPANTIAVTPAGLYFDNPDGITTTITAVPSVTMAIISSTVTSISNFSVIVNSCLGVSVNELNINQHISLYPNPASNLLNISTSADFIVIASTIFDVTGKLISSNNHQTSIDVSKLNTGIYFIKVITDKGEYKQKFIKE